MSNDLISRSAVISLIDELGYVNCHNSKDFEANSRVDKIRQGVVELPTAYDVDNVMEQLEKERNIQYRKDGSMLSARSNISIDTAIEIVKAGGANE